MLFNIFSYFATTCLQCKDGSTLLAPNSQDPRNGDERMTALTIRHSAMTRVEMASPIVSMARMELPGPVERNPFMKVKLGMKK